MHVSNSRRPREITLTDLVGFVFLLFSFCILQSKTSLSSPSRFFCRIVYFLLPYVEEIRLYKEWGRFGCNMSLLYVKHKKQVKDDMSGVLFLDISL